MKTVASHKLSALLWIFILHFCVQTPAFSQSVLNYQGRVISGGTAFNGTGQFKFAIVSADGSTFHWKNDGTTTAAAPATAVSLPVNKGLFSVQLGDASVVNMGTINSTVLSNSGIKLRVWFSDGRKGWEQFEGDIKIHQSMQTGPSAGGANLFELQSVADELKLQAERIRVGWGVPADSKIFSEFFKTNGWLSSVNKVTTSASFYDISVPESRMRDKKQFSTNAYMALKSEAVQFPVTLEIRDNPSAGSNPIAKTFIVGKPLKFLQIYTAQFSLSNSIQTFNYGAQIYATIVYVDGSQETQMVENWNQQKALWEKNFYVKPLKPGVVVSEVRLAGRYTNFMTVYVEACRAQTVSVFMEVPPNFFEVSKSYRGVVDFVQGGARSELSSLTVNFKDSKFKIPTSGESVVFPSGISGFDSRSSQQIELELLEDSGTDERNFDAVAGVIILKR